MLHHQDSNRSNQEKGAGIDGCLLWRSCRISQSCVIQSTRVCTCTDQWHMLTSIHTWACVHQPLCHHEHKLHWSHPSAGKVTFSCVVVTVIPHGGGWSDCRCTNPAYPLSPTRCWHYHFSYLDFGGDCGLGRCKRPAEARCLPPCRSPRLGSRRLNPLLNSHIQK